MKDLIVHVKATDPATFAAIAMLFVVVALAGSYIPARRGGAHRSDGGAARRIEKVRDQTGHPQSIIV